MYFKTLPSPPSAPSAFGQVHLWAYQNKAENYCNPCRHSVCITSTCISTCSSGMLQKYLHTKLVCLTEVLLGKNTNGWALWGIPTEWEAWRLKSLKNPNALIITVAIFFVHKLWRYSDFSCRSILLFQEENIFPFISVYKQVSSAGGISIFHP